MLGVVGSGVVLGVVGSAVVLGVVGIADVLVVSGVVVGGLFGRQHCLYEGSHLTRYDQVPLTQS